MSHGDQVNEIPPDFHSVGKTSTAPFAAIAHNSKPFFGIQFHPEVTHTPQGKQVIGRFILNICECAANWTMVCIQYPLPIEFNSSLGIFHLQRDRSDTGAGRGDGASHWCSQWGRR